MAETSLVFLIFIIVIAGAFDFVNGFHDAANAIATVVSTRVLTIPVAVGMAGLMNFAGAISGTAVAKTIGSGIVATDIVTLKTVAAGLLAAIFWEIATYVWRLPTSASHSLIAGLAGAGIATGGWHVLVWSGVSKVFLGLFLAPIAGFIGGYVLMILLSWIIHRLSPSQVRGTFGRLQILSAAGMAFSHGSNDAQKTMGIIALALGTYYGWSKAEFHIPFWVIVLSASVIAAGTYAGGRRMIHTLGVRIVKMEPFNGFAAESAAAGVIESASRLGFPLSTTHVISSSIMGQGAIQRLSAVRWGVVRGIVLAWVLTFPLCALLGAGIYRALDLFM